MINDSNRPLHKAQAFDAEQKAFLFSTMRAIDFDGTDQDHELFFSMPAAPRPVYFRRGSSPVGSWGVLAIPLFELSSNSALDSLLMFMMANYETLAETTGNCTFCVNPRDSMVELLVQFVFIDLDAAQLQETVSAFLDLANTLDDERQVLEETMSQEKDASQ
ncbi:MAG: hypothetical protein ACK5NY_00965 [Burkholderiaceae bacterium]|jgi:hypothetical protein